MITSRLMFCAEGAVRDAQSNTISVFNISEEIQAGNFPAFVPRTAVVVFLERENGDPGQVNLTLTISLGEETLNSFPVAIDFAEKLRNRLITDIRGLPVPGPGTLTFALALDERSLNSWDAVITAINAPELNLRPA